MRKVLAVVGTIACLLAGLDAAAQPYPNKPLRIIVPWPPGGSTDTLGRLLGQRLAQPLGQNVVIDNRPGGAGSIGIEIASRATPDGYTVAIIEVAHALLPVTRARLPYNLLRDFAPIPTIGSSPMIVFVGSTVPVKSVAEL